MNELAFLMSPYLIDLPMQCLGNMSGIVKEDNESATVLLLDVLLNKAYLVEKNLLLFDDWDETKHYPVWWNCDIRDSYFRKHNYYGVEIEINSHCNHKCCFCPTAYNSQPIQFISLSEYERIISEIISCNIKNVSLNHYSEPTLHPDLVQIISIAIDCGLNITLFTNGSDLNFDIVDNISRFPEALEVVVNFPEHTEEEYCRVTKSTQFSSIVKQINYAKQKLPVKVVVNNSTNDKLKGMANLFPGITIQSWKTDDRTGILTNNSSQVHDGRMLNGCPLAARFINISIDGDVFLCAQDYYKTNVFGNIKQNSLAKILEGEIAERYRKWIFGAESPPEDFICRRCSWTQNKMSRHSIGSGLNLYDLEVYTDIVCQLPITRIIKTHDGVVTRELYR